MWLFVRAAEAAGAKAWGWILPGVMQEYQGGSEAESTEQGVISDGNVGCSTSGLWVSP